MKIKKQTKPEEIDTFIQFWEMKYGIVTTESSSASNNLKYMIECMIK